MLTCSLARYVVETAHPVSGAPSVYVEDKKIKKSKKSDKKDKKVTPKSIT
jgi:hypothetical protein